MTDGLVPGGVLALFYGNYYQATFLPGHSRLERLLKAASELRWDMPGDGPDHYNRHVAWLVQAGLREVEVRAFPRVDFPVSADPTARVFLETAVWPDFRASAESHGAVAGMSTQDIEDAVALLTPGDTRYVLDEPGYHVVYPAILVTGRRAAG